METDRRARDGNRTRPPGAGAFLLLAANWLGVAVLEGQGDRVEENMALFYILRLLAFIAIIVGIVDKNRVRQ